MTNKTINLDHAAAERIAATIDQGALFYPEDLEALRAALAEPVPPARCSRCGCSTVKNCDEIGCGFLGAGNGEPVPHVHEWDINAEGTATVCHCGARSSDEPVPPAGGEGVGLADFMREAQTIVESKFLWKRFIDGTPLSNDIGVWMAEFARDHLDQLQVELANALEELDTLKDAVHHTLDDSEEDAQTGQVTIYRTDFDKLIELVPEEWHDRYHNQSAPALIETLRANGDRITMEATIAQQAQRIADLEAGKGQCEPVVSLPSEGELIAAGFGYPLSKEDAVQTYEASLQPRTDHPRNEDCEHCYGAGHDYNGDPCVGCCKPAEQPAPVAVVMPERKTVTAGLLSESNTHNRGWNACLDEVTRLNQEPKP